MNSSATGSIKYDKTVIILILILTFGACIFPIWSVDLPPLTDYPNHLARMYLLTQENLPATLARYYQPYIHWQPNLAMDLIIPALAKLLPLAQAGKVFLSLTIASMVLGTVLLYFAVNRHLSPWPLLAFLFVYNRFFLWGFVNYLFSVGLALTGAAVWMLLQGRSLWLRIPVSCGFAMAVYLGHLYAFGVYGLIVTGIWGQAAITRFRQTRTIDFSELAAYAVQFIAPPVVFLLLSPTASGYSESYWGTLYRKIEAPFVVTFNYHLVFDIATLLVLVALLVFGLSRRFIRLAPQMYGALIMLLLAYLVMPDKLFTSYGADRRLVVPISLLIVASTEWHIPAAFWRRLLCGAGAALLLVRMSLILSQWQVSDGIYRDYIAAIDKLPIGAKLIAVTAYDFERSLPDTPLSEFAALAVIRRQAIVPILFAYPKDVAQSLRFTAEMQTLAAEMPEHIIPLPDLERLKDPAYAATNGPYRPEALRSFDYLLLTNEKAIPLAVPAFLRPIYVGDNFRLLQVEPH